tara:strand:- start:1080 stop:1841 length:762 start_codon:yes stop_codon:yes gene_type:complete
MSSTFIIAIITIILIASFIISAVSYSRQQALKKRNQLVKRYHQQADEALSHISLLLCIDQDYDLIIQLQNLVVNALSSAAKLNFEDQMTTNNLSTQKLKLNEYKSKQRSNQVCCWLTSDTKLTATQTQLGQLKKLIDLYRNKGDLSLPKHQDLQNHIQKLQQEVSTNTYLYQADLCAEQNNITSYQLNIKQAIQVIKKSMIETSQKNQRIKELSDRIQEVKRTGKTSDFKNFIKPTEPHSIETEAEPETDITN